MPVTQLVRQSGEVSMDTSLLKKNTGLPAGEMTAQEIAKRVLENCKDSNDEYGYISTSYSLMLIIYYGGYENHGHALNCIDEYLSSNTRLSVGEKREAKSKLTNAVKAFTDAVGTRGLIYWCEDHIRQDESQNQGLVEYGKLVRGLTPIKKDPLDDIF